MKKSIKTREYILEKSLELFNNFGYYKTAMDDISKYAKVGKGTIYYYFKSKNELFSKVVEREGNNLIKSINKSIKKDDTPEKKLEKVISYQLINLNKINILRNTFNDKHLLSIKEIRESIQHYTDSFSELIYTILVEFSQKNSYEIENKKIYSSTLSIIFTSSALGPLLSENSQLVDFKVKDLVMRFFKFFTLNPKGANNETI